MKTIEKVVRESIDRVLKRLAEIKELMDFNPISEIIAVRKEFADLLEANQGVEKRTSKEFGAKIDLLHSREKKAIAQAKKQTSEATTKLIDEQIDLESELRDLRNELFRLNR